MGDTVKMGCRSTDSQRAPPEEIPGAGSQGQHGARVHYSRATQSRLYRGGNKGLFVLLSRTQAGPGRTVKQEQKEISRNHVQTFICLSVLHYANELHQMRPLFMIRV